MLTSIIIRRKTKEKLMQTKQLHGKTLSKENYKNKYKKQMNKKFDQKNIL